MIYRPGETDRVPDKVNEQFSTQSETKAPELSSTQPSHGILNDFDMASTRKEDGSINSDNGHHHHITGTRPFMALDLLGPRRPSTPAVHLYRHDLESFFYILIWAATHYKYSTGALISVPKLNTWNGEEAFDHKSAFILSMDTEYLKETHCLPEFYDIWDSWITPLFEMFGEGRRGAISAASRKKTDYDLTTYNGRITFETFMAAIGETPRGLNPASDTA
ncbi:hypothetical protein HYPSUDRAFT_49272 [Hypholoma sublateritium FD-334 SS-4]|uniref:Fungal-type protein kinase domain-containing protein n=1 Tax=Hypholoma sublateritium (strain FD-334 SS-4) TaxID=945553 RepID=A0A0D2P104_HYPSF|nr:hypothetical protein HYPSUDRAFT_49272 [Hypholoma sublateritium FD-334 SS-4]